MSSPPPYAYSPPVTYPDLQYTAGHQSPPPPNVLGSWVNALRVTKDRVVSCIGLPSWASVKRKTRQYVSFTTQHALLIGVSAALFASIRSGQRPNSLFRLLIVLGIGSSVRTFAPFLLPVLAVGVAQDVSKSLFSSSPRGAHTVSVSSYSRRIF